MYQEMSIQETYSAVYFYIREKLWRTVINICKEGDRKFGDPFFIFWKAYAIFKEGNPSTAVTEIQKIESKRELQWASIRASIMYHEKCKHVDTVTVDSLRNLLMDISRNPSEKAVTASLYFELFNGNLDEAVEISRGTKYDSPQTLIAKGWCDLLCKSKEEAISAQRFFDEALRVDQKAVEAYFGLSRLGEKVRQAQITHNAVNDILDQNPDYVPGLLEKCRLGCLKKDYASIQESYTEILKMDRNNILAYVYSIFYSLSQEGNLDDSREKYEIIYKLIMSHEPDNLDLIIFITRLVSRLCGRASVILNISLRLIERCRQIDMMSIEPLLELGINLYMIEDFSQAYNTFKMAASLNTDMGDLRPMLGMIKTQIAKGELEEAALQLQFMKEMVENDSQYTPEVHLIEAMLLSRKKVDKTNIDKYEQILQDSNTALDNCLRMHLGIQKNYTQNLEYFCVLNPDFLLTLANEMLFHADFNLSQIREQIQNPVTPTHLIKKSIKLLDTTISKIPGLIPAYMLSAKANLIVGNTSGAIQNLQKAMALDPKNEEAYILNAIVVYGNGNATQAYSSVNEALANNFEMDKIPFFMMLKGQLEMELEDHTQGLKTLQKAYNLPGIQDGNFDHKKKARYMTVISFNENIRSQVFVEYAKALAQDKQYAKSKEIMEDAIMEFAGTDDEPVVLIGNADIAAISGDLKKALTILRGVQPEAKGYMEARKKLADIYLNKMLNRRQYAKCFQDLVNVFPNFENYKRYGDALLEIQEADKAIEAYEEALKIDPTNQHIVRLIGQALSSTHNYQRAIGYYQEATQKFPNNPDLRLDQAKLLVKNNFFERAEELLDKETLFQGSEGDSMDNTIRKVEGLVELATIYRKNIDMNENVGDQEIQNLQDIWKRILALQLDVIDKSKYEGGKPEDEKLKYASLCEQAGELCVEVDHQLDVAKEYYEEAYKYNPNKTEVYLELAEIDFVNGETEDAKNKCSRVLKSKPNHPWALKLLAEILLTQGEMERGAKGFERVYEKDPSNFIALGCLFEFYRRLGRLDDIKEVLTRLDQKLGKSNEPGFCYVKGLYYFYRKHSKEALTNFYIAKRNPLYKNASLKIMIEIYLNPDQDLMFTFATEKLKPFANENLTSMEVLLDDLTDKYFGLESQVYSTYVNVLSHKEYKESELFLQNTINESPNLIPAIMCLCVLKMAKGGKSQVDKNLLKSISKSRYNAKWGEETERGWIQVADFLISANKFELAERELNRCLKYNQSSAKAWELLGSLAERNNDLAKAAENYERAWAITENNDCTIGFRLASLYFKNRDFVNTVIIGKKVLNINPNYPKLREEIVEKAHQQLRP